MPKLSPNFTLDEFTQSSTATKRGISNQPEAGHLTNLEKLAYALERIRALVGAPIAVSSGYRSKELNKAVRGSENSAHCRGLAADIHTEAMSCKDLAELIRGSNIPFDQVIYEGSWVHFGLAVGDKNRQEVLTAVFTRGKKPRYISGIE